MQALSKKMVLPLILLSSVMAFAQEDTTESGGISTEKLIIIKPYSPTVSDAVKERQNPEKTKDSTVLKKKEITYDIFSVPVASTFEPEKGKAAGVKRQWNQELYDNYAAIGAGNYTNIMAQFYSNIKFDDRQNMTVGLNHLSSQGGINGVELEDKFYDTDFDLSYTAEEKALFWNINFGVQHQLYNWYGLFNDNYSSQDIASIDPTHNYIGASLGGDISMKEGFFDGVSLQYQHFNDDFQGNEDHLVFKPKFRIALGEDEKDAINIGLSADYLNGHFGDPHALNGNYSWFNAGIHPGFHLLRRDWSLDVGVEFMYSADTDQSENDIYVYSKLKGSYRIAGDYFTLYAGLDGGLDQNTYYKFAQENPFVAPDLAIRPTNTQYNIFAGAKGKFVDQVHYNLKAGYKSQKDKPLFGAAYSSGDLTNFTGADYQYNNSFAVRYDDIETLSLHGGLDIDFSEDFNLGLGLTYYNYSTNTQAKAWNLPEIKAEFNAGYKISKKWSIDADFIYMGERHDLIRDSSKRVAVDDFFDLNLQVNFQITDQFGVFARGNNLTNDNYGRWYHNPVQGVQGMLGLSYQF